MNSFRLLCAAALLVVAGSAQAQESIAPAPVAEVVPYTAPLPLPPQARLTGIKPVYQLYNRCAAAALTMQLSYFGWNGTYYDTIHALNPNADDVAVRLDEMAGFAEQQGLSAVYRIGGTPDLLRALVAGGFPVLVKNAYYDGPNGFKDFMGHNRVIMGYDDSKQTFYAFDSLLGDGPDNTGRPMTFADLESRWRPFNRAFLVLYRPDDESKVEQIMAGYWDADYGSEMSLELSQQEIDNGKSDSFTLFNMGSSLVELGRYDEAAADFDQARKIGLPWRMMWYQYGPFEAYYHVGRYDDVLTLARDVIATTPGVEESYYYAGLAYEAEGDPQRAKNNYAIAVWRNSDFTMAKTALSRVGG